MMFGFACTRDEGADARCPSPGAQACQGADRTSRESGSSAWLRPDGKSQVSVEYGDDGQAGPHRHRRRLHPACRQRHHRTDLRRAVIER
ncbi:MAG: hypothetical protein ACLU3I_22750 [Acutalibacteraceae bacterium]